MAATANVSMVQTRSKGTPKGATKAPSSSKSDASPSSSSSPSSLANALAIATGAAGVYASYLTQGVLQERLATTTYAGGKRFDGLDALHGAQAAACAVFALLLLGVAPGLRPSTSPSNNKTKKGGGGGSSSAAAAPPSSYWRAGLSNSVGPTLGYLALKNISYPAQVRRKSWHHIGFEKKKNLSTIFFSTFFSPTTTRPPPPPLPAKQIKQMQVLAKSCKMIPVMLMGTVLSGKRYSLFEYCCAAAIAGGVALFAGAGSGKAGGGGAGKGSHGVVGKSLAAPNAPLGYALCLLNLLLDGYTNAAQDELHSRFKGTPPLWTMAWMNAWCALYNGLYLFVRIPGFSSSSGADSSSSSAGSRLVRSLAASAEARRDVALFCACGAVGQLFIFYTIARFGSLTNTIITTTRKFFNILLSVLWLGTPLGAVQWAAVALVFSGLGASSVAKAKGKGGKQKRH